MSIIYELYKARGKKVCPPNYTRVQACPLILRSTSEDIITANTFGILKNLNPHIWLQRFLSEALQCDFTRASFNNLKFEFWKKLSPPGNLSHKEGISEVDMVISFDNSVVLVEAKYLAPLSLFTTHCTVRNQIIRYIDVGVNTYLCDTGSELKLYLVVISSTDKESWLIKRYRKPGTIYRELTRSNIFIDYEKVCHEMCRRIGWINWKGLREILESVKKDFLSITEQKFIEDLIRYLLHKEKDAIRITQERNSVLSQLEMEF